MPLKMAPRDIAFPLQVVASLKPHVHQVTVAGVQGEFGQHYDKYGQSSCVCSYAHVSEDGWDFFFQTSLCPQMFFSGWSRSRKRKLVDVMQHSTHTSRN